MKKSLMLFSLLGCVAATGGTIALVSDDSFSLTKMQAITTQTTKRIWIVNKTAEYSDQEDYAWNSLWVYNTNNGQTYKGKNCVGEYWERGLWFFDLPSSCTKIVVTGSKSTSYGDWPGWTGENDQTVDIELGTWASDDGDVIYVTGRNSGGKKGCSGPTTAPVSSGQLAWILTFFDSCSSDYAKGYNAYPQIMNNFVNPSTSLDTSYIISKANEENASDTTIAKKLSMMQKMYYSERS